MPTRSSHSRVCNGCSRGLLSPEDMREMIAVERYRCDRYSGQFAVAVLLESSGESDRAAIDRLARVLREQKRLTDSAGWLERGELAVLLPETGYEGAKAFAERVLHNVVDNHGPPRIYVYPGTKERRQPSPAGRDEQPLESIPPEGADNRIEELLAVPSPAWKRALDIVGSSAGLIALSPLMLSIAALIKIVSPGPVFFRQERVGYMGRIFTCLKFRTMHPDSETSSHRKYFQQLMDTDVPMTKLDVTSDARLIPMGKILRQTGLDELPQLINVLRGDMSLVGPRPCIPYEYDHYCQWQRQRTDTAPGLTGLWQVSGKNRTTFKQMMRLDVSYSRKRSPGLDLKIIFKTLPAILTQIRDGARKRGEIKEAAPAQPQRTEE